MKEFHLTKVARDKYQFDEVLFSKNGNVIFANFHASREFAHKINQLLPENEELNKLASPADINALGLIDEIFHQIIEEYYRAHGRQIQSALAKFVIERLGGREAIDTLVKFNEQFPPVSVYQAEQNAREYLKGFDNGINNYDNTIEELLTTWLHNMNPAASSYRELFDDRPLYTSSDYAPLIDAVQQFFKTQPTFGPENQDLISMLRAPALRNPDSLSDQLEFIRETWSLYLSDFLLRLLGNLDIYSEEAKARSMFFAGAPDFSHAQTLVPQYGADAWSQGLSESENFSQDSDWMPRVVMVAKNAYVWLNQLSRLYQRDISRLDQIPDEVLDQLVEWGFTGLWLIGLWERSDASREIKQMSGNPEAVASAYSLARYKIAERLGGESAWNNLSERCGKRGIRLASDMVPNHMGIDSDWVYEHPDWFIQTDYPPFPNYQFNSPDLSKRPNISIHIEDHYYSRSDASVVFKHYDHESGKTRYIYHGNDGTSMPWNDTAQLNYLDPTVREAVIQTILDVARKSPIIRFDAAMTLTKKHYQRLWFPQPGTGGDIPSRADFAMTKEDFDKAMPEEFWREVVDRVASEVPDTLLLAEAFWLMEGYFVRTLGMHRVYNSAFMHMMRNEENEKYRQLIKNTLVYDPQILKRYVNFMNNPDEETALEQFGKGDKYFGICTLLSTMPGLPMFGHGQVEGYSEKYGMEYYRPYRDETPDQGMIDWHAKTIFPLLHRRKIFAEVDNFRLYDLWSDNGGVDENVFAYSNGWQAHSALVIYNNHSGNASGWIKQSAQFLVKDGDNSHLEESSLADALHLQGNEADLVLFRQNKSGLWYLRSLNEIREKGMHFELQGYDYQVLLDFNIVNGPQFAALYASLNGRGIADIAGALEEFEIAPTLEPLRRLLNQENFTHLIREEKSEFDESPSAALENLLSLLRQAGEAQTNHFDLEEANRQAGQLLDNLKNSDKFSGKMALSSLDTTRNLSEYLRTSLEKDPRKFIVLAIWSLLGNLAAPLNNQDGQRLNCEILSKQAVSKTLKNVLVQSGFSEYEAVKHSQIIQSLILKTDLTTLNTDAQNLLESWLENQTIRDLLEINEYQQIRWFNREQFEQFIWYQKTAHLLRLSIDTKLGTSEKLELLLHQEALFSQISKALENSEYKLDNLLELLD